MLQPIFTDNKIQYAEAVKGPTEPTESLQSQYPNILGLISIDDDIQRMMINKQWEHLKLSIKKYRTPRTLVQLADIHFYKKNFARARDYYIEAIKEDKSYFLAYDRLIFCLVTLKEYDEIDKYYQKWLEASNRQSEVLHNYVIFKIFYRPKEKELVKELLGDLDEIITKNPKNFAAIDTEGFILLNIGDNIPVAKEKFNKVLEINPKYTHSINSLGTCYLREKKIEEAIKQFKKVISIDDKYPPAYENLASAYFQLQDKKLELKILQEAISKGVEVSRDWEHKVGWLKIQLGDFDEAIKWYEEKIKEETHNNLLFNNLGICYLRKGEIKKARGYFEKAISIFKSGKGINDQRSILAFYNLSRTCLDMQDDNGLEMVMEDIRKINYRDPFLKYLRGNRSLRTNDYDTAKKYFDEVLVENPNIPEIYPDYGFILECIDRDYQKAIDTLLSGINRGFVNIISFNNLIYAYIRIGNLVEAEKILGNIKDPLTAELLATRGMLLLRKGELQKGNDSYTEAIKKLTKDESKKQAEQIWRYEQALYYLKKKNLKESKVFLEKAKELGVSYLNVDLEELENNLKKASRRLLKENS